MNRIIIKPSMALDTICFLQQRLLNKKEWMKADQIKEIEYINGLLPTGFDNEFLSMSSLCLIISSFYDDDLEALTLDDFIRDFQSPKDISRIVKGRIKNEFTASYLFPMLDWLNQGYANVYVDKLKTLKNIGFETIYNERILPLVQREGTRLKKEIEGTNPEELFRNISIFKNAPIVDHADIYVSFFSYPTAFKLYNGSFLTCFTNGSVDYYPLIAHELMHGFASDEAIRLYKEHVESDERLRECHRALIEYQREGDEEEFVIAAECYLCYLSGYYPIDKLRSTVKGYYGGYCPTAVAIFEQLIKEHAIPADYNGWLIQNFFGKQPHG
ncbi:MAG: hypothetical protein IJS71_09835 [Clostridia bacterium]|nr:hypothetical protein [Clostridia bacterium]